MKIGVLALQGDFAEHVRMLELIGVEPVEVRLPAHLEGLSGLCLPGGESTTMRKLIDRWELREPLRARARAVVVIGEARPRMREALGGVVAVHEADTLRDAVATAYELARPSGVVLLAPACASFDMFSDYAERGRKFKEEAINLQVTKDK